MNQQKSGLWSFFTSVKLTMVLLALIVVIAIAGTLVPQREAALELHRALPPGLYAFLFKIQVFDLYHSIWFFLLMGLLSANLIVCSLDRFPMAWRRFRAQSRPDLKRLFHHEAPERTLTTAVKFADTVRAIEEVLSRRGSVYREQLGDGMILGVSKGRFAHFGVFVVHLGILVLVVGVVIGSLFGVEGYMQISEDETASGITLRGNQGSMPLEFGVRCDRFIVEFYDNGMPKTYQSDLTFLAEGRVMKQAKLRVNHPVTYGGYRFYQSSFGPSSDGLATLALTGREGNQNLMNVRQGYVFDLPYGDGAFQVLRVERDLMKMGAAVKVMVRSNQDGREEEFWIFQHIDKILHVFPDIYDEVPMFNPASFEPYSFELLGLEEKYFTGLQVSRDPGVPVVLVAAFLLIAGLMGVLLVYARQIWVLIEPLESSTRVRVTGVSYKNQAAWHVEIKRIMEELSSRLEKPE